MSALLGFDMRKLCNVLGRAGAGSGERCKEGSALVTPSRLPRFQIINPIYSRTTNNEWFGIFIWVEGVFGCRLNCLVLISIQEWHIKAVVSLFGNSVTRHGFQNVNMSTFIGHFLDASTTCNPFSFTWVRLIPSRTYSHVLQLLVTNKCNDIVITSSKEVELLSNVVPA